MTTILSADHLSYRVGHATILADLSLAIEAGRRTAIIGPNGSGKSTLSATLAGRDDYEVSHGSVEFNGQDLPEMSPEHR